MTKGFTTGYCEHNEEKCWREISVVDAIAHLEQLRGKYGDGAEVTISTGYDGDDFDIGVTFRREETDQEYAERMRRDAQQVTYRKRQYEQLKKEFEA